MPCAVNRTPEGTVADGQAGIGSQCDDVVPMLRASRTSGPDKQLNGRPGTPPVTVRGDRSYVVDDGNRSGVRVNPLGSATVLSPEHVAETTTEMEAAGIEPASADAPSERLQA
jgi:hypothetical protein